MDRLGTNQKVFVFDLGGGTLDVTLMEIGGSKVSMIQTNGDHHLGGKDWDDTLVLHVAKCFENEHGIDPIEDLHAAQELRAKATAAKEVLSQRSKTTIVCQCGGKSTRVQITRDEFERLTQEKVEECKDLCGVVLNDAKMSWNEVDTVLLVGGSTRMPMIRDMLARLTGKSINATEVNPDEAVALGAALHATLRKIREGSAETKPVAAALTRQYGSSAPAVEVNDGLSHHLGIIVQRTDEGNHVLVNHMMIEKMTPIPCTKTGDFGSPADNLPDVRIAVVEGLEHHQAEDDSLKFEDFTIGELFLKLPPGTRKGAKIVVTYKYNADQILKIHASGPDGRVFKADMKRKTLNDEEVTTATAAMQYLTVE